MRILHQKEGIFLNLWFVDTVFEFVVCGHYPIVTPPPPNTLSPHTHTHTHTNTQ